MQTDTPCPSRERLEQALLGLAPEPECEHVARHLLDCTECVQTVAGLGDSDTLVSALRQSASGTPHDPEIERIVREVMARVRERIPAQTGADQATQIAPGDTPPVGAPRGHAASSATAPVFEFLSPAQGPDELGRLGGYRVLRVLGVGGMGVVFHAEDPLLKRGVALKVMKPQWAQDEGARQRYLREAQAAAALEHDHIVAIFQVGVDASTLFMAMPLLKGESLQDRLQREPVLPVGECLRIAREMVEALAAAHAAGIIHRDIKPGNIWLEGTRRRVKVLDFGLARPLAETSELTHSGAILGTPAYMAPEQGRGERVDGRADLFSLGCVLYRMATGKMPFPGENTMAVLTALAACRPIPPREHAPDLPQPVADFIMQLLSLDRDERPASAQAVAERLTELEHQDREQQNLATAATQPQLTTVPPRRRRSVFATIGASLAGIALLASIIIKITWKDGTETELKVPDGAKVEITNSEIPNLKSEISNHPGWHGWPADAPPPAIAPFDAEQATKHQEAWAKHLKVPVEFTNSIGMKFRLIPPGEFLMGSTPAEIAEAVKITGEEEYKKSEGPQHKVILTQPTYLGIHEVTQADYEKVMGKNPSNFSPMGKGKAQVAGMDTSAHPVEMVSWGDAAEFCAKLSQKENLKPFYFRAGDTVTPLAGTGYRLPSEAEWEFACRAGTTTKYWIGDKDEDLIQAGWIGRNSGERTHAVGELKANPFGLYDINGNIWELVEDRWEPNSYRGFQEKLAIDPLVPASAASEGVLRGGYWHASTASASDCRAASRHGSSKTDGIVVGFRVLLVPGAVKTAIADRDAGTVKSVPTQLATAKLIPHKPMTPLALVMRPAKVAGAENWTLETAGHRGAISDAKFSPKGTWLATADSLGCIRIWEPLRAKLVKILVAPDSFPSMLAWSPDELRFASAESNSGIMRIWDVEHGSVVKQVEGLKKDRIRGVSWSADGKRLVTNFDKETTVWDTERWSVVDRDDLLGSWVALSPDDRYLAGLSPHGALQVFDFKALKPVSSALPAVEDGRGMTLRRLAWSPNGDLIAVSSCFERTVWLVKAASGDVVWTTSDLPLNPSYPSALAWSPKGNEVAVTVYEGNKSVMLLNAATGERRTTWEAPNGYSNQVCDRVGWSPDGKTACAWLRRPNELRFIDPQTGNSRRTIQGNRGWTVRSLAWFGDESTLVVDVFSWNGLSRFWKLPNLEVLHSTKMAEQREEIMEWRSPGGHTSISAYGMDLPGFVKQSKPDAAFEKQARLDPDPQWFDGGNPSWSVDGNVVALAVVRSRKIWLYEHPSGKKLRSFDYKVHETSQIALSPDAKVIVFAAEREIGLISAENGELLKQVVMKDGPYESLAYSPDGQIIAAGTRNGVVKLWKSDLSAVVHEFHAHTSGLNQILWSGDGQRLVTGSLNGHTHDNHNDLTNDPTIRFWNPHTGESLGTILFHRFDDNLAVAPSGHYRASPPEFERDLFYVVQTDAGQLTLTPAEFAERFGWKNDPEQVRVGAGK